MRVSFGLLVAIVASLPVAALAQEFRATISGDITDPTGAMVAGAKVTITETNTGTRIAATSNMAGHYTAPFLLPGDYDIAVHMEGFREFVRRGVHVGAGEHPGIDIRLEVGDVATSLEVTADAPLLNTENGSLGQAITTKEVAELPINGRTPIMAASLALGVIGYGQPGLVHPFDAQTAAGWSVGGAYTQTSELLVNGAPNATWDGRLAYSPPQDAVLEVRIKASDTDAAFGHTGGGTLNQVTKSGTNNLRGSAWEFNQPNTLAANDFFNNQAGKARPVTHLNQYGVTAGGPVLVPKVFNGRNKLFWFFAFEGMKDAQPNPYITTVPTAAERKGDFSQILATDGTQLYDPYSAVRNGSTITRSILAGNQIPQTAPYLSSAAQAYLKYVPLPNVSPQKPDGLNNFAVSPNTPDNFSNEMGRLDFNMSDRSRLFFDIRHTDYAQTKNNYFGNIATGSTLFRNNWGTTVDEVYTLSPTNMCDLRINFTRMNEGHDVPSTGFDPTALGFPAYMTSSSTYLQMPIISFASNSFQQIGFTGTGADRLPSQSLQLFPTWIKIKGSHSLKFGGDIRQYRLNTFSAKNSTGQFSFNGNSWVRASSSASSTVAFAQDMASFVMGLPYTASSSTYDVNTFASWYSYYAAVFVQDDWRVTRNLTVNAGLRFDHDGPYNEKYGRTVNGFDTTTPNPLSAAAQAAYAKAPVAQLSPTAFHVLGGLTFPGSGGTAVYENTSHLVSPRFGFAWTPDRLHGKTVFRGGFGMFVAPVPISQMDINGKYSTTPNTNQEGFSQSTALNATNDNYLTPAATLNNPYPNGFLAPSGSSLGLLTFAGQGVTFLNPQMKSPYSLRWNFGIQQSLGANLMLEVVYIHNHSVHLPIDYTQLNGIPRQFLSTLPVRDPNQTYLANPVPNPFFGLPNTSVSANSNTTPAQLLARFPQFPVGDNATGWSGSGGVLEQNVNLGSSYFNSLNVRLQKRLSQGLSFTVNYVFSKLTERVTWLNASDPIPEKRISAIDHPQRIVTAINYELPFGRGRQVNLQSRWANALAGGWVLHSVYTYQTGQPLQWTNGSTTSPGDYVYLGAPIVLNNRMADPGVPAFKVSAFDTKSADAFNYHLRTFPTMIAGLRQDGINHWDPSVAKRFEFTEKSYLQLRFEFFNGLNHPVFPAPNTTATNALFGTISGAQANRPRMIQLGARVVF
ncbi:MAG: TonB-dependent receptor [Terriglobia bacterium]|nr:MAG: TonB-dependent receptor [Terriglobia bacterium]